MFSLNSGGSHRGDWNSCRTHGVYLEIHPDRTCFDWPENHFMGAPASGIPLKNMSGQQTDVCSPGIPQTVSLVTGKTLHQNFWPPAIPLKKLAGRQIIESSGIPASRKFFRWHPGSQKPLHLEFRSLEITETFLSGRRQTAS